MTSSGVVVQSLSASRQFEPQSSCPVRFEMAFGLTDSKMEIRARITPPPETTRLGYPSLPEGWTAIRSGDFESASASSSRGRFRDTETGCQTSLVAAARGAVSPNTFKVCPSEVTEGSCWVGSKAPACKTTGLRQLLACLSEGTRPALRLFGNSTKSTIKTTWNVWVGKSYSRPIGQWWTTSRSAQKRERTWMKRKQRKVIFALEEVSNLHHSKGHQNLEAGSFSPGCFCLQ